MTKEITYTVKVDAYGDKYWYLNGKLHREDGPAIEYAYGSKSWYLHGKLHREDGPAIEFVNGYKEWYLHDKLHREDGPAIEHTNGTKYWYLNGKDLTEQEFLKRTQKTQELTVAEIEKLLGYPVKIVKESQTTKDLWFLATFGLDSNLWTFVACGTEEADMKELERYYRHSYVFYGGLW